MNEHSGFMSVFASLGVCWNTSKSCRNTSAHDRTNEDVLQYVIKKTLCRKYVKVDQNLSHKVWQIQGKIWTNKNRLDKKTRERKLKKWKQGTKKEKNSAKEKTHKIRQIGAEMTKWHTSVKKCQQKT